MAASYKQHRKAQPKDMIFALDIGTRKIIGIVGTVEGERLRVIAMEKEEHTERSMIDGQIEDIDQVARVADIVKKRLEAALQCKLKRVCIAAAGRALKTQSASFEMEFPKPQRLDEEIVSRLNAGAISQAETAFSDGLDVDSRLFYLVGHTIVQYHMDNYPVSNLSGHHARRIRADAIATFLPSEVVDSLYSVMHKIGLEVTSLTLEPIAAINAAIPQRFRLLNLALVDIGAGTSDIAVTRDGGVVGYTMATVAGDEITEALMRRFLLDFNTAELAKTQLGSQEAVQVTDIMGIEQTITKGDMLDCTREAVENLCREISDNISAVNGGPVSAVFLAGGGSKLEGIRTGVAGQMGIDESRVAIAGNNFQTYAFSDSYELSDPEYATPLGIAVSAGLNLITDSFHILLNGSRAKLFRNSTMTVLDVLMMNGYSYKDLLPKSGHKLTIQLNGAPTTYYGTPGDPAVLCVNGKEARISDLIHTGDSITFTPAVHGTPARRRLRDLLESYPGQTATVNGAAVPPDTLLKNGDSVWIEAEAFAEVPQMQIEEAEVSPPPATAAQPEPADEKKSRLAAPQMAEPPVQMSLYPPPAAAAESPGERILFHLNNRPIVLPKKKDGSPYYLMDMIEQSGIDLANPTGQVVLKVNGADCSFLEELKSGDYLEIGYRK